MMGCKHDRGKPCHYYIRNRVASHAVANCRIVVTGLAPVMPHVDESSPPTTSFTSPRIPSNITIQKELFDRSTLWHAALSLLMV